MGKIQVCPIIIVPKFIIEQSTCNGIHVVKITCGNDVLSPSCEDCPKSNITRSDEQWCGGNCRIDENDGKCKENSKLYYHDESVQCK